MFADTHLKIEKKKTIHGRERIRKKNTQREYCELWSNAKWIQILLKTSQSQVW